MEYFVSIENTPYFHWQIELLIESFKKQNIEDKLLVGIVNTEMPTFLEFTRNLYVHSNKFSYDDYGHGQGCPALNRIYGLILALQQGLLKQPFALIHADMVLQHPLEEITSNICFSHERVGDTNKLKPFLEPYIEQIFQTKGFNSNTFAWPPVGGIMIFKDVPEVFFRRAMDYMLLLLEKHGNIIDIDTAGFILAFHEFAGRLIFNCEHYELNLRDHELESNFIHYKHGLPPTFSKQFFTYKSPFFHTNFEHPYEALIASNATSTTQFIVDLIEARKEKAADSQEPAAL